MLQNKYRRGDSVDYKVYKLHKDNKDFFVQNTVMKSNYDFIDTFIEDSSSLLYFVTEGETICGVIYGYVLTRMNSTPMLYIHSVDVYKDYRRKGIGTLMIDTMIDYAKENDLLKVFLITNKSNEKAMGLYSKTGGKIPYNDDVVFEWKDEK